MHILDVLEDNDFIEMIDEHLGERCYRFNHAFLTSTLSHMMPFREFKYQVHSKLTEFHKLSNFRSPESTLEQLLQQLLLQHKVLYPEKLDAESRKSILRKEITLRLNSLQQIVAGGGGQERVVEVARVGAAGVLLDEHVASTTKNQKPAKKSKSTKNKYAPVQQQYHQNIEIELVTSMQHKQGEERHQLVLLAVRGEAVEAAEGEDQAGEADVPEAEAERQKRREVSEPIAEIDVEDIGAITESTHIPESGRELESHQDSKVSKKKQAKGQKARPDDQDELPDARRDAPAALPYVLGINYS